uniref:L-fucose mutarotase n=1 Tax=Eubacterium sp. TaxID=142586 RepID=UPI0040260022
MLLGIPAQISPDLLKIICEMGHGDEIVLADANFPSASTAQRLIRADGIEIPELLSGILELFPLDQYDNTNFILMEKCEGDTADVSVWSEYENILKKNNPEAEMSFIERFDYYERAKKAYAVVATGERRQYANIILKKGCVLK